MRVLTPGRGPSLSFRDSVDVRPGLRDSRARPSDHSIHNHAQSPQRPLLHTTSAPRATVTTQTSEPGLTAPDAPLPGHVRFVRASPYRRRLAEICSPNRFGSFDSTDWSFTFHCSPPRLAARRLCSISGPLRGPNEDLHLAGRARFRAHVRNPFRVGEGGLASLRLFYERRSIFHCTR